MRFNRFIIVGLAIFFIFPLIVPLYAKGKPDSPPGQEKKDQGNSSQPQVVIGSVENIKDKIIVVEDKKGNREETTISDLNVKVIGKDNKPLKLGAIKLKDMIALISAEGSASAEAEGKLGKVTKIYVKDASSSAQSKRRAVSGVITAINNGVITLAHIIHRDRIYYIQTSPSTVIHMKGNDSATVANLAVGMHIAAVGDLTSTGSILAKRIHVIPGLAIGVFNRFPIASPSATLTATPSATPVLSSTPSATLVPSSTPSPTPIISPTLTLTPTPTL